MGERVSVPVPCDREDCPHVTACTDKALIYRNQQAIRETTEEIAVLEKRRQVFIDRIARIQQR